MNRKQKIIVSITGIIIVALALLGLTYAYYLTRIEGNTNTNSISITTADLTLTYRDGTGELIATNIMPGDEITSKTFTVKNDGNQDVEAYMVALINIMNDFTFKDDLEVSVSCSSNINSGVCEGFAKDYEDNIYKEKYPAVNSELFSLGIKENETHTFTLTVEYLYQDFDQSDDMGKTLKGKVQIYDPKDTIEVSGEVTGASEGDYAEIHSDIQTSEIIDGEYKFIGIPADNHTVYIKNRNTNTEKSTTLEIKKGTTESTTNNVITFTDTSKVANVTIDTTNTNLSATANNVSNGIILLKDLIIINAKNNIGGRTIYSEVPITTPAEEINGINEMTLSTIEDDYGTSYYFRGNNTDNYINFNNMCWRIVRIQGDGSIKLILEDQDDICENSDGNWDIPINANSAIKLGNYGYEKNNEKTLINYLTPSSDSEPTSMSTAFKSFQNTFNIETLNMLKSGGWCYNDRAFLNYDVDVNSTTPLTEEEKQDYRASGTYNAGMLFWDGGQDFYYDSYIRLYKSNNKQVTNKCRGTTMNYWENDNSSLPMYIGVLTADEIAAAGLNISDENLNCYLINDYQIEEELTWWTITPIELEHGFGFERVFNVYHDGYLNTYTGSECVNTRSFRPSIVLRDNVIGSGTGTIDNPYTVKLPS